MVVQGRMIKTGDIFQLGSHRLMCGDAGDRDHVAALFGDVKPDLVFTSPPYDKQRDYKNPIDDWGVLMARVFLAMPWHEKTQVLVNLGLVHRDGEWQPYWDEWIFWMREIGWRRFGWYVWDKGATLPVAPVGRLNPTFEFIWHFNRQSRLPNKTEPCKWFGRDTIRGSGGRNAKNNLVPMSQAGKPIQEFRVADSTLRITSERNNKTGHPAVFPVALPLEIHAAYTDLVRSCTTRFVVAGRVS